MWEELQRFLVEPALYERSEAAFWEEEYISQSMLQAHLAPEFEGASRKWAFMDESAAWIAQILPPAVYPALLDVGCGPGLYAERFARAGFHVMGVDISSRSLAYARESAKEQGLAITYSCQNYLRLALEETFDLATMIYCDYGALSDAERRLLLRLLHGRLRAGGRLLLDVFTPIFYEQFETGQTWTLQPEGGFWRGGSYVSLERRAKYGGRVTLEQSVIVTDGGVTPYYLWSTCFTPADIKKEAQESGFKVCDIYGDVAGRAYTEAGRTMAVLLEKV